MEAELPEVASKIQRLEALALAGTGFHQIIASAVTLLKTGIIKFCQLFDLDPRLRIQRRFWEAVLAARADIPRTLKSRSRLVYIRVSSGNAKVREHHGPPNSFRSH
jgi:hypothetical protein